jgi:hypothetical protein
VPSHSASNGFLIAAVSLINLWDVGPIVLGNFREKPRACHETAFSRDPAQPTALASASGKFEQRRVRVVAFIFAVAVFVFAVLRTAVLPR